MNYYREYKNRVGPFGPDLLRHLPGPSAELPECDPALCSARLGQTLQPGQSAQHLGSEQLAEDLLQ